MSLIDSDRIFNKNGFYNGVVGRVENPLSINDEFSNIFKDIDLSKYSITTWIDRHSNIIKWLDVYNRPLMMLVFFIIILATFNISLSLWIFIQNKLSEISMLLYLGFNRKMLTLLFIFQNMILSMISIFLSLIFSFSLLWTQKTYKLIEISEKVYFMDYIPVSFDIMQIAVYCFIIFIISVIVSLIPAYRLRFVVPMIHVNND